MDFNKINLSKYSISIDEDLTVYSGLIHSFVKEYRIYSDREYIVFCLQGYAKMEVNLIKHTLVKNEILLVSHNQILFHHEISEDFRVIMFSFSIEILRELLNNLRKYPPFFVLFRQSFPVLTLNETEKLLIVDYYNLMINVLKDDHNDYRRDVVKHLLCAFLINIHCFANEKIEKPSHVSPKQELLKAFFSLIFEHYKEKREVSFYADKLCVSPKYLTSIVKKVDNKTAKDCIDLYVILQSKVLLNTTLTIQEISQQLNFPNQSFFGKYFKKHTGMSPINYRKSR